jgi:TnpA family transposase
LQRDWTEEELVLHWTLQPDEQSCLNDASGVSRLGLAILFKFFQFLGRFPRNSGEVPAAVVEHVARQVGIPAALWPQYQWHGRTMEYHRARIRFLLGFREATLADGLAMTEWLTEQASVLDRHLERLTAAVLDRYRSEKIEPPAPDSIERMVRSAVQSYDAKLCQSVWQRTPVEVRIKLQSLLLPSRVAPEPEAEHVPAVLQELRADAGPVCLETIEQELDKLDQVRALGLPKDLFASVPPRILQAFRQRAAVEALYELRRHPEPLSITLLAAYCHVRGQDLTDTVVDLLVDIVHHIGSKAESRVEKQLIEQLERVAGKNGLLYNLAEVALGNPDGVIKEVIYPVVSEEKLRDLVKEFKSTGPAYRKQVQNVMRNSWRSHYRRLLPRMLATLEFRSSNEAHKVIIDALQLLKKYANSKTRAYPLEENVPINGIIAGPWMDAIYDEDKKGRRRVNRVVYEICVLQILRERLRCKEIWVVGANRYRNPDEDLPADFEDQRSAYYAALRLPQDEKRFVETLREETDYALAKFNRELPSNECVRLLDKGKGKGWISLSPLEAQPEPANLEALKSELIQRWPMTSLLDIFKEADFRIRLTDVFRSVTPRGNLDRDLLHERLLLSLYGIGSNTGLRRISSGQSGHTYRDLLYVRHRYITKDSLRQAIAEVVNKILEIRLPEIWGEGTTACASDSKKFGAWDQNLMTQWHARYKGPGVMIYWHVERRSACIYSQLKTCSSSEVAAMIEGVLRHCTEMSIDKQYVDSHGQSEVGFAFCRLLGFQLLPRLKGIHRQKLCSFESGAAGRHPNLSLILSPKPLKQELLYQQYDHMVKYTTALRTGTAQTEDILRRFTRNNAQHPTYQALAELGRACKTIFLCRYLGSLELRHEIQEALNVIEHWNNVNDFIRFGKGGDFATNQMEEREISMLALHLLQICLVYINMPMIQRVLDDQDWMDRLTETDRRGLTPLLFRHVNPYGSFLLDMTTRIPLDPLRIGPQPAGPQLRLYEDVG